MRQHQSVVLQRRSKTGYPERSRGAEITSGLVSWVALAAPLHFAWEWMHAPFYTFWQDETLAVVAYSIAHCTAGDAFIAGASYLAAVTGTRAPDWPNVAVLPGTTAAVLAGVGYTAFSEWLNVYRLGSWAYAGAMPLVGGIGLTPLLQWLLVPLAVIFLWRRFWPVSRRPGAPQPQQPMVRNGGDA